MDSVRTVSLRSGGRFIIEMMSNDFFRMSQEDRDLVFGTVEAIEKYERAGLGAEPTEIP